MKNLFKQAFAGIALALCASAASAAVVATVTVGGGDAYYNDYDVTFGLGSTAAPTWSQQVAWSHHGSDPFDNGGVATADITSAFDAGAGQSWWVLVDDNWGGNSGFLQSFTIDTGSTVYTAADTQIYIPDNGEGRSFINLRPVNDVPEPMTIALLGAGLAGLGVARRRRKA